MSRSSDFEPLNKAVMGLRKDDFRRFCPTADLTRDEILFGFSSHGDVNLQACPNPLNLTIHSQRKHETGRLVVATRSAMFGDFRLLVLPGGSGRDRWVPR